MYPSGKTWYEASGKKSSRKKFYHNFISGADCAAQPYHVATIIPSLSAWGESPYPSAYSDDKQCRERDYEGTADAREEPGFLCFVLAFSTTESLNRAWSIATGNL